MFDAYTIKKVMPRLVAAAILIQLSWPLITQGINIVSQLSWGLEGLIYAPFGGREALDISKSLKVAGGNTSFSVILGGTVAWLAVGAPGMMALAIAVLFALLTAFITLIIRQILIIMLVLTAPLAIVAWILPNTEHLWKLWWSTLSKALLMYPIFLLLMATGRVAAHLAATASTGDNMPEAIGLVIVIVLYFLPFFLMAKAFQMAGGAIAATSNAISSRGSRYSGAANKRAFGKKTEQLGNVKNKFQAGEYGSDRNALTRGIRRAGQRSGQSVWTGFGATSKGKQNMALDTNGKANELLKDGKFVDATYDDGARLALQLGSSRAVEEYNKRQTDPSKRISDEALSKAKAVGFNASTQLAAIKAEASNKGRNYKGLAGVDALNAQIDAVAKSTGVNAEDIRSEVAYGMRTQGGRHDLGALNASKSAADQAIDGWKTGSLYQHANGQDSSLSTIYDAFQARGNDADTAVFHEEVKALQPNATGKVGDLANEAINRLQPQVDSYYASGSTRTIPGKMEETIIDPVTGNQHTRVVDDPANPTTSYDNKTRASHEARTYRSPNPNEL